MSSRDAVTTTATTEGTSRSEWRAGWPAVVVGAVGLGVTSLHFYSIGIMIQPLTTSFGWSRGEIAAGSAIVMIINLFAAAWVGRTVDRIGVRRVAIPGYVAYCTTLAALGLAGPEIWTWYALWLLLGLLFPFASPSLWTLAVAGKFERSRGLALAVALSATGIMGAIVPVLGTLALEPFGWRGTYALLGGTALVIGLPLLLLFLKDPEGTKKNSPAEKAVPVDRPGISLAEALTGRPFWLLTVAGGAMGLGVAALIVHFIPIGIGSGLDATTAATVAGFIGLTSIFARLLSGILMDHLPGRLVGGAFFVLPVIACLLLAVPDISLPRMIIAAIIIGLAAGAEFDVLAVLVSRYLGMRHYGAIYGQIAAVFGAGVGLGPAIGGYLFDGFGSYEPLLLSLAGFFLIPSAAIFLLGREPQWSRPA